jgi:hypothetical protein
MNIQKTRYILFYGRANLEFFSQPSLSIKIQNETIDRVGSFQYLGQIIDEQLSFKPHIEHISKKITPMIYAIKRIRKFVKRKVLLSLYFAYVNSHLIFMSPLWGNANSDTLNRLFILQKKCLKIIYNKHHLTPSQSLFSESILPLPVLIDLNLLTLAFKIKNGLIKNNVVIQYVGDIHTHDTRQRGDFYVYTHETRYGFADFYKRGLIKFNELPSTVKLFRSLSIFKTRLREYLYSNYQSGSYGI